MQQSQDHGSKLVTGRASKTIWRGMAGQGEARRGKARHGEAWSLL